MYSWVNPAAFQSTNVLSFEPTCIDENDSIRLPSGFMVINLLYK